MPILRLAKTVKAVEEQKAYSLRAEVFSRDEVGQLTDGFNQMLAIIQSDAKALRQANNALALEVAERQQAQTRLEELQRQLIESSRKAGMAEIATGVLHNVGNVLNSVNVSATLISNQVETTMARGLKMAIDLLRKHASDLPGFFAQDPAGPKFLPYLENLNIVLEEERDQLFKESTLLRTNVDHIKEIVTMQQTYACRSGVIECLAAADLLEDALKLHLTAMARHGIHIERDYGNIPPVMVDRHKVYQILLNLISNAKQALKDGQTGEPRLRLRTRFLPDDRIRIEVADNGIGILPVASLSVIA